MHGHSGDQRVGRLLGGRWRIEAVLGEGASSTVYAAAARSKHDRTRVAIKVLRAHLAREPEIVEHFFAESRLCNAVEHPGVVKVLEEGMTDDGCPYLVLELLVGQTLDELRQARGGRVPLEEVMPIADAIMATLEAVHAKGIVHRDLKPQNVIVLDGGGIKLVDFGVAKVKGHTVDAVPNVVGTPSFMPPEQALGMPKKMDAQSDIWALGATLFHLLSGQPVHLARHQSAMLLATASTRPRSLADAAPELPRRVVEVIDRALAYRKIDRWSDVGAMRSAWHAAHPEWLPTLPPPSFDGDPAFVDANLLMDDPSIIRRADTPMAIALFDPRELVSVEPEAPARDSLEGSVHDPWGERLSAIGPQPPPPTRRVWSWVGLAATAIATVTIVTAAILLSADERPRGTAAARHAQPPPPAMELPLRK